MQSVAKRSPLTAGLKKIVTDPWLFGLFVVLTLSVLIFAILPIASVLRLALSGGEGNGFAAIVDRLTSPLVVRAFLNTIQLGVASAVLATLIGFLLAFSLTRTNMWGKKGVHLIALLPVISPPFVIALAIILLFGRSGLVTRELLGIRNSNIYGFQSLVFIQALAFTPIAYLNIRGMLQAMDSALEDAAATLRASQWTTFRRVTLPLTMPALLSSMLLVFVKSIEDFGNPLVIGGNYNTLAVEAYSQLIGYFNLEAGAMLASLLLLPSLVAFMVHRYWVSKRSYVTVTGKPANQTIRIVHPAIVWPLAACCYALVAIIVLLYGTVIWVSFTKIPGIDWTLTTEHYARAFTTGLQPLWNSLLLAAIATPIITIMGILIAYILARRAYPGSFILRFGTLLAFAAPGTIIGIGYVSVFNTPPLLLTGTAFVIVAAMVVKTLQVGIEAGTNQIRQIDPAIEEAAAVLGASNTRIFSRVTLPLLKPALFASLAYGFTRSLTTLSAIIFLVSANWTLITVTILNQVETMRMGLAAAYSVMLIAIVLAVLGLMQVLLGRSHHQR
ncbi:Sulfate transport system permease protein CysW [Devosia equisanguinis]|uniref:Sulfate transport system permease protein CysW n=1 Tax=Devosia equisanguinis TaxID=2490941 RepID=A0A447I9T7_9HYPH|nr:iron ABC transporter permease [Devosia equisanguinis]VDS04173.1 Sulfate transport system permease protein CysW [Devosia equisanguinis]